MLKKGRIKYFLVIFISFSVLTYGFIKVNINKTELVRNKSKFTIGFKLKPVDFRIETKDYGFYVNNKIFDNMKKKCISTYNGIFSK
ncbi:hypothetical protein K2F40_00095 [Clostridium sp. CM028]|uniref:hypothetical protein n=1 Tax=unclassified Clostridium TaxID=2614128 RepID=UPI001C0DD4B4|nr:MULTISPECIES: hypothetical protein [unclassified Clostridium]MBU3090711.1 hypothetical protein [Clostridium sp. CF011]MBW9144295.1 hypothetical protein [Clostridium sp. CM027]MBW9147395.1 hypothetical protein [Clostridium sp. CM028]UVE41071.1 hypothetical protein KTC92_00765 [Clostridium sp. CM027]WAG70062.1 hypothetical protein LL036_01020 [Clostridium sp. CF011]